MIVQACRRHGHAKEPLFVVGITPHRVATRPSDCQDMLDRAAGERCVAGTEGVRRQLPRRAVLYGRLSIT
jgi:hypothetical protein